MEDLFIVLVVTLDGPGSGEFSGREEMFNGLWQAMINSAQ